MSFRLQTKEISVSTGPVNISYLVCEPLEKAGFQNAFSTRHNGVSSLPKSTLNMAYRREDASNVDENRRRFLEAIGQSNASLTTVHQIHSDRIHPIQGELRHEAVKGELETQGDALITTDKNHFLGIKSADCVAILIGDPVTGAIAAVHAGWKGTLKRIVQKSVKQLTHHFGSDPRTLIAASGPAACGSCYEVGIDVAAPFEREFPDANLYLTKKSADKYTLDVGLANVRQLLQAGLHPANLHANSHCTIHDNKHFFSHRKEGQVDPKQVGRMLAVVGRFN